MSVVLISDTATNDVTVEILKQLANVPGGIISLCDEAADKETRSYARRLRQAIPNNSKIKLKDKNMVKSIATLKMKYRKI